WNWMRDNHRVTHEPIDREQPDHRPMQIPDPRPLAEAMMMSNDRVRLVQRALSRLPERQRAAVIRLRYSGMSDQEMAESPQCSTQSVKALLFRAHCALRDRLAEEFGPAAA